MRYIYINSRNTDIQNAKMLAAAYKGGIMQWINISEDDVSVKADGHQSFVFNITDTEHDTIKLFIWDSVSGMKPYDCYTFQDDNTKE